MTTAIFQQIHRAKKIVLHQLASSRSAIDSRQDAGIRSGVDRPIGGLHPFDVTGVSDIPMKNSDPELPKAPIRLTSQPHKIVDSKDFSIRRSLPDSASQHRSHEAAYAGDENLHRKSRS